MAESRLLNNEIKVLLLPNILSSAFPQDGFIYLFIWASTHACGILVPQPGIEHVPPAVETWSLNHWTAREVPEMALFFFFWLHWVFVAAHGPSLVAASRGYYLVVVRGLLICGGFSCCGARDLGMRASVVVARGLSSCDSRALERRLSSCGARA